MTTTRTITIRELLNNGNLNQVADLLRAIKFGNHLTKVKVVVTGLTATATPDLTSAAVKAAATITGLTLQTNENLPPIGQVLSLRVAASGTAAAVGTYLVSDAGGTAEQPQAASDGAGIATLNDAGTVLTFPNTITAFTLVYYPAPYVALETEFYTSAP